MSFNQWFEQWANTQIKEIKEIDNDTKRQCTELTKAFHNAELELINIAATIQQLRDTIDNINDDLESTAAMIRKNSDDILKHMTACPHPEKWKTVWNRLTVLETAEHKREGSGKWETIIINSVISVSVALTILILTYFMAGGRIAL